MLADATRGGPGSVILMHCNHAFSLHVLPRIIAAYRARGFRFVTIRSCCVAAVEPRFPRRDQSMSRMAVSVRDSGRVAGPPHAVELASQPLARPAGATRPLHPRR